MRSLRWVLLHLLLLLLLLVGRTKPQRLRRVPESDRNLQQENHNITVTTNTTSVITSASSANFDDNVTNNNTTALVDMSLLPATTSTTSARPPQSCEVAKIKCALRSGCSMALQNYMLGCADLIEGRTDECDDYCRNSLIALTSNDDGQVLMNCECSHDLCRQAKARAEVCRDEVLLANAADTVVSCNVAHWICAADTLCATALQYYDRLCRRMFSGRGCSHRCNNSISILQRQPKAAKLETCICDGSESFDCVAIKDNMARLCFYHVDEEDLQAKEEETNKVDMSSSGPAPEGGPSEAESGSGRAAAVTAASDPARYLVVLVLLLRHLEGGPWT
ncbi:growth arrest-specific protein 1-like [Oratosquilla oratoria]|uniref:growth arrest-specific protein 1-like n=1 Tax=Oratosquilla oratoria TaxID=337810 RepID=UPI003F7773A8